MADFISNFAIKLTANASNMVAGLNIATNRLAQFAGESKTAAMKATGGVGGMIAKAASMIGGSVTSMAGGLLGSIGSLGTVLAAAGPIGVGIGVIAGAGLAMGHFAMSSISAIATQQRLGREIGLTAQEAAGLQIIGQRFDIDSTTMGDSTKKWADRVGELRAEMASGRGGAMSRALSEMGIDAERFVDMRLPDQFAAIREAAGRVEDPLRRQALVHEVIGRKMEALRSMFTDFGNDVSVSELANMGGVAAGAGFSISQGEAEMIETAMNDLELTGQHVRTILSNVGQGAAVAFAPLVIHVAGTIKQLATEAGPVFKTLAGVAVAAFMPINWVILALSAGVRFMMPVITAVAKILDEMGRQAAHAFSVLKPLFVSLGEAIVTMFGNGNPMDSFGAWLSSFATTVGGFVTMLGQGIALIVGFVAKGAAVLGKLLGDTVKLIKAIPGGGAIVGDFNPDTFIAGMERTAEAARTAFNTLGQPNPVQAAAGPAGTAPSDPFANMHLTEFGQAEIQPLLAAGRTVEALERLSQMRWFDQNTGGGTYFQAQTPFSQQAQNIEQANQRIGLSREEVELMEARNAATGVFTEAQERNLRRVQAERNALEENLRIEQERAQAVQQMQSPYQRYEAAITRMNQLGFQPGTIQGDAMQASAFLALENSLPKIPDRAAQAVMFGSVAERAAINAAAREARRSRQDPVERVRQVLERALEVQREQRELNRRIARAVEENQIRVAGE